MTEQKRSDDPQHNKFVQKLSMGEAIQLEDICSYKRLSMQDIKSDPDSWKFAPILVATNKERMRIVKTKSQIFAFDKNTIVFKWKVYTRGWVNKPSMDNEEKTQQQNSFFWQYFVVGAEAFLSQNLNSNLGLANGTSVICHSVSFSEQDIISNIESKIQHLPAGSEIELLQPPTSVNFRINPAIDGKTPSPKRLKQLEILEVHSIVPDDGIILPVLALKRGQIDGGEKWHRITVQANGSYSQLSSVEIKSVFPFELAFAMTVHKAQGRTISRVVLALTCRPDHSLQMKFAAVYVALSRVECKEHLRLLFHDEGKERTPMEAFGYLATLRPNKYVVQYYGGFYNKNGTWDMEKALQHKF